MTIAKIRRIGNSKGILFPKSILDASGIKDTVQITVKNHVIMISATEEKKKKQWSDFKKIKKEKSDFVQTEFDKNEWKW